MKEYNIGLDIGTNSVGWAVTDLNDNLLKHKGKYMWGVRRFDTAETAAKRRLYRSTRRRMQRRKERINLLQELIGQDVLEKDPTFFLKLSESYKVVEDLSYEREKVALKELYNKPKYIEYNLIKKYPTIYHLRQALYESNEKMDIRLIYLALHHAIKYRGNFLYEGQDFKNDNSMIVDNLQELVKIFNEVTENTLDEESYAKSILEILKDNKQRKLEKKDSIMNILGKEPSVKNVSKNIAASILGYSTEYNKIFPIEEQVKFKLTDEIDEEKLNKLQEYKDKIEIFQSIYSWVILQDILNDSNNISEAFIKKYDKYKHDLVLLKKLYKKYAKDKYNNMFKKVSKNSSEVTYYTYNKYRKKVNIDELYKKIKNDIKGEITDSDFNEMIVEIDNNTFLRRLNIVENSAIPYQLHKEEVKRILQNQSKYYKTIEENKEKIISILEFKIPYYVGPLSRNLNKNCYEQFAWIEKIKNEKVLPWNFNEIVDTVKSAENFITRMTNKCTYLLGEDVIPKNSLLYSEFCLYQELNKITINNKKLDKVNKNKIINELFKTTKNVKDKKFREFLIKKQIYSEIERVDGYQKDKEFASSLTSYIDFKRILGKVDETNYRMIENIIRWITLFEDKKILNKKIRKEYDNCLNEKQIKEICKLKYTGWSKLSEKLLVGLRSDNSKETIMDILRETSQNLMQIINKDLYGFNRQIEESYPKDELSKIEYDEIEKLYGSPALKRGIWQTTKIVEELVEILKQEPKNIYIEFAREDGEKKRTKSRAKRIEELYKKLEKEMPNEYKKFKFKDTLKDLKNRTKNKTIMTDEEFLYYTQNGKSLYSMKPLSLEEVSTNYDVDHIIPRSIIKDDSLSNKALVFSEENKEKSDKLCLSSEVIKNCREWWGILYKANLIDSKKYYNLIRTQYTVEDKEKFINRQLVETRQVTKHVANLLIRRFKNTKVNSIKANLTSGFREKYNLPKDRNINNYHHAQDAYLAILVGNLIQHKFKNGIDELDFESYIAKYKLKNQKYGIGLSIFDYDLQSEDGYVWKLKEKLDYIEKILSDKNAYCYVTYKLEELTGMFYKETIESKNSKLIPINSNLDPVKYGGFTGENSAYGVLISYKQKEKLNYGLISVPVQKSQMIKIGKLKLEDYLNELGYEEVKILKNKILKRQKFIVDGKMTYRLASVNEWTMSKELILDRKIYKFICLLNTENKKINYKCEKLNELDEIKVKIDLDKDNIETKKIFLNNGLNEIAVIVYENLVDKMKNEYVDLISLSDKLLSNEETFKAFDLENKVNIINAILKTLRGAQGDLSKLKCPDRAGRLGGKSINTRNIDKIVFVDESVTGIYERRYKASELENSCNN